MTADGSSMGPPGSARSDIVVDPDALTAAGREMYGLRDTVNGILENLTTTIANLGQPWGNDSYGNQFASGSQGYLASRDDLIDSASGALPTTASSLEYLGDDMVQASEAFGGTDDSAAGYFDPFGS